MHDMTAPAQEHDRLDTLLERHPWSRLRLSLLVICFGVTLMDGFHQLTMAISGPSVSRDMGISPVNLGFLMAASEFGFMLGALTLSPLVDRWGRKRMLLISTLGFTVFSIATAYAPNLPTLFITRLFTGIGLGCAGPAVVSLATEYAPVRHRAHIATLIWAANPAGAFLSGILGGMIVAHAGWRALFLTAGGVTLVLVVLIAVFVPESLRFLLTRSRHDPRITLIARQLGAQDGQVLLDDPALGSQAEVHGVPVAVLFEGASRIFTIALWAGFFLCFMCLLASLTWIVTILSRANLGIEAASGVLAYNSVGGALGVALAGWALERFGGPRLLVYSFVLGALAILAMAQSLHSVASLNMFSALTGLCIGGNSAGLIALAVKRYPTTVRATGLGWALAAGRLGGAMGPVLMGLIAQTETQPALLLSVMAVPALLAAFVSLIFGKHT